jgi:hypothetical protein
VIFSHWFETCGDKNSNHVKGWCGSGRMQSLSDFDGLYAPKSWFLKTRASPIGHRQNIKQKKRKLNMILLQNFGGVDGNSSYLHRRS